jgi:hypothetical protein
VTRTFLGGPLGLGATAAAGDGDGLGLGEGEGLAAGDAAGLASVGLAGAAVGLGVAPGAQAPSKADVAKTIAVSRVWRMNLSPYF